MSSIATDVVASPGARPAAALRSGTRDLRLDFFRGLAMFIILISHTPGNAWSRWIPARFGFSDATEIFVFCSGMASAIAFGATFARAGWALGTARTVFRIWQVYWAHIGLFFALTVMLAAIDLYGSFEIDYIETLNLGHFFNDLGTQIVGLFTLTYVPNYFDILPMYLGILALLPVMMALARVDLRLLAGVSITLWLAANAGLLDLPAEPWSDRSWFFNPFGWQLVFFTGFAFMTGWLPAPPVSRRLIWIAVGFLVLTTPLSSPHAVTLLRVTWPAAAEWAMDVYPGMHWLRDKTEFGILRYVHFLALAYVAWIAVGERGHRLLPSGEGPLARAWGVILGAIVKVGQQSLAVFIVSMVLSQMIGFAFNELGRTAFIVAVGNLGGCVLLFVAASLTAWFKSTPWKPKRPPEAARA